MQWGWFSAPILSLIAASLAAAAAFWYWERRSLHPVIDPALFQSRVFSLDTFAAVLQSLGMFSVLFLMVFYLQGVRGETPIRSAILILPMSIVQSVLSPLGGIICRPARHQAAGHVAGLLLQGAATLILSYLKPGSSYAILFYGLAVIGIGGSFFWSPNTRAVMNAAPRQRLGVASATLATLRQCGMVMSIALAMAAAATSISSDLMTKIFLGTAEKLSGATATAFNMGLDQALRVSTVIVILAAVCSWLADDRSESSRTQAGAR